MSDDNDAKEKIKDCLEILEKISSKAVEIFSITINSIIFVLLILNISFIKWKNLRKGDLVLFIFMFIISIIILVLSIIIRIWRSKNIIKTLYKKKGSIIAIICIVLSLIFIILTYVEIYYFNDSVNKAKIPCPKNNYYYPYYNPLNLQINKTLFNNDIRRLDSCKNGVEYITSVSLLDLLLASISLCLFQYFSYIIFGIWLILRKRIKEGLDGPEKAKIFEFQKVNNLNIPPVNDSNSNGVTSNNQKNIQNVDVNSNIININQNKNPNNLNQINLEIIDSQEKNLK